MNLEKEIEKYYYEHFAFLSSVHIPTLTILSDIAKHFYRLGESKSISKARLLDWLIENRAALDRMEDGSAKAGAIMEWSKVIQKVNSM